MLMDTREKDPAQSKEGFNPNVVNKEIPAKASGGAKFGWWFLFCLSWLTIIGGIIMTVWYIGQGNRFNAQQVKANEASSNIDIQLAKRRDTLVKLVDATQSSMKFEKSLLTDITSLRNINHFGADNRNQASAKLDSSFSRLLAQFEAYPNIKSTQTVQDLMQSADYIEREIAASRRLYNATVTDFNQKLYTWPAVIVADRRQLHNLPLFVASETQRTDVSLKMEA